MDASSLIFRPLPIDLPNLQYAGSAWWTPLIQARNSAEAIFLPSNFSNAVVRPSAPTSGVGNLKFGINAILQNDKISGKFVCLTRILPVQI